MEPSHTDRDTLRRLGAQVAEIAQSPLNRIRRENADKISNLKPAKPLVSIYQVPWNEMDVDGELTLTTEAPWCRGLEWHLRETIYSWNHMPGDMVVGGSIGQPYVVSDTGFGISEDVDVVRTDDTSDVVSRHFNIQIRDESDVEKIKIPQVSCDAAATEVGYQRLCQLFDGILPVHIHKTGSFWFAPWDELVRLTGVTEILTDMILRPSYVNALMDRFVTAWLRRLGQYEALDLLSAPAMQLWGVGAAQIFSEVSPAMHEEFALQHEARWYERFGMNYYGCCEPLDDKVDICLKHIPRLRKISMSPWVDFDRAVRNVGDRLIFAWKPNPAIFAGDAWDPEWVRKDMREKLEKAKDCIVEIHLKDISTVRYKPQRLWEWARIASEVTQEFAK